MPRRYTVIGAGAVGGYYGALLQRAGVEVHFLLHTDYEHVRRCGLVVDSREGRLVLPAVDAYDRARDLPPCDVVLVALKTTSNTALETLLPAAARGGAHVLMLQNGLGVERVAARVVGERRVMGGLTFLCSHKKGPGHICHLDYGEVTVGAYRRAYEAAGVTGEAEEVVADFLAAGVPAKAAEDLLSARWRKLVWNIPFNGLSVITGADTNALVGDPGHRERVWNLMREVQRAAKGWGRIVEDEFLAKMIHDTEVMVPYATSMKLDFEHGRPMEIAALYNEPIRMARTKGVAMPLTSELARGLRQAEKRRQKRAQDG